MSCSLVTMIELHPDHLSMTVPALKRWPTVGVVHTGCVIVDLLGNTLDPHARVINTKDPIVFESGGQFIERSMKSGWTVCFSSATFRRTALVSGEGLRPEDGVIDDLPLLMRIATDWDFAYLNRPLAQITAHAEASSSSLGSFTPNGYRSSRSLPDMLYEHRRRFLTEANLSEIEARRLAHIAERTHRRDRVRHLSMRATTGDKSVARIQGPWERGPAGSSPSARSHNLAFRRWAARGAAAPRRRTTSIGARAAPSLTPRADSENELAPELRSR